MTRYFSASAPRRIGIIAALCILVFGFGNLRIEAAPPPAVQASLGLTLGAQDPGQASNGQGSVLESQIIEADVTIAGLSWSTVAPDAAWVRASSDGETWGPWESIAIDSEHGPDPSSLEATSVRPASEPVYLGDAEWIQFRVDTAKPDQVRAEVVETAGRSLSVLERIALFFESIEWGAEAASGAPDHPDIVPREAWGGPSCNPNAPAPSYTGGVRMMFVHHTTTYNTYPAEDVLGIIYAMCSYHVDTRGWNDIGYNFVIDRFGTIYEARAGGIEKAVWGAHTGGFNYYSFGVALIGDHDLAGPSQASLDALDELAAWKMDLHHVDPTTIVTVESLGSSKFASGVVVSLSAVSGHMDASATSCPGDFCYPLLGEMQTRIRPLGGAKIFGGLPDEVPPVITEDVVIPFTFSEQMDWSFRLVGPDGATAHESSGTGTSSEIRWDGTTDGALAGRGIYTVEMDATTTDDGETPTPVRFLLEWYKPPFADDDFNRHESNIGLIADAGITAGCSSVLSWLYCPDQQVRRDQMAAFIVRALDLPPADKDYFSDDNGNSHEALINALAAAGITSGCGYDLYCPLEPIRRDHMAAFLARALDLGAASQDYFDDDDGSFEGYINSIAEIGVTLGCGERRYCPDRIVERDEMASFLARAFLEASA